MFRKNQTRQMPLILTVIGIAGISMLPLAGCDDDTAEDTVEDAADTVEEAADEVGDAIEDAVDP